MATKINWCDETWNIVTGCTPISLGCANCYAKRMANRLKGRFGYPKDEPFNVTFHEDKLNQPLHWKKPRRIFVCSMGDLFHHKVSDDYIMAVWASMGLAKQHRFIVLTKRPGRMNEWLREHYPKPLFNIMIGTSIENQECLEKRLCDLVHTPAAARLISFEPLLGQIEIPDPLDIIGKDDKSWDDFLDWIIIGAESGPGRRKTTDVDIGILLAWASLNDVPAFLKQRYTATGEKDTTGKFAGQNWRQRPAGFFAGLAPKSQAKKR